MFLKNVSLLCEKDIWTVSVFIFTRSKSPPSMLDHDLLVGFQSSRLSSLPLDLAYFLKINISKNLTFIMSFPYPLGILASFRFWSRLVFATPFHWFPFPAGRSSLHLPWDPAPLSRRSIPRVGVNTSSAAVSHATTGTLGIHSQSLVFLI